MGEYTALAATGALEFEEGVVLVTERANAMHEAGIARPGTMAAVLGLDDDQVEVACDLADDDVWVANFNAPGQVVIAGSHDGVETAGKHAKELGAKRVMALPVSGAFHTNYMAPARDRLREAIRAADIRDAEIPVVSNVDAAPHDQADQWGSLLSAQLASPVRWKHCLLTLAGLGVTDYAELGPGGVLTGMAKRTVDGARTISVATPDELDKFITWMAGDTLLGDAVGTAELHEGEHLAGLERLVVSPAAGVFTPTAFSAGDLIEIGALLGTVGEHEVRSPFRGVLQSFIAVDTERLTPRQPVAWLRTQ